MDAPDDKPTPSRSGMARLISPWEYRHLRSAGSLRLAAGGFQLGIGVVLLGLGRRSETDRDRRKCYRWATWFLVNAALQFTGGILDMTADRAAPPRT
jgi:low temperature requirement protein LtrA